ncbi:MAG TPA: tRNA pseudouridine(38-40) synthase TruA [Phycisphaerae bacterium]|nr:tRNA pseudouridine(38-40) synthase TruA [Phycisphaerae bacterium]HPS53687.1 tRNA pseudouridine(38-40) synthase TruA [Phycisphaerae bacterium]
MTDSVRNLMLVIAYDGRNYHGWQRQADGIETVQLRVEDALRHVLRHPLTIQGCSRTDAGVHAQGQVVSVKTGNSAIPAEGLRRALNSRLPADIVVRSVRDVPLSFNASGNACGKTYRYRIYTAPTRPVELAGQVYCYGRRLDAEKMRQAAARLTGRHDFAAFASAGEERENTVRTIFSCTISDVGDEVEIWVRGDGFLYNMVRNIAGTLVEVGRGHWPVSRIDDILAGCDRVLAGPTAPPDGLTLMCVHYPPDAFYEDNKNE